ncbi:MAG: HDOD domain-containing protein [Planctomycetes bacterium]|nr:HDOD domain-containing protein [Planctomycetota bacterium]
MPKQASVTIAAPPPAISLDAAARRVTDISTLPQVALRVMEVAQNPEAGAADLKAVVEGDPALSARVVRMVNSAAYGLRNAVTNLHQAISYLGFSQIRNLAMTASVSEIFRNDAAINTYSRRGLWKHLVSVGVCARLVARRCGEAAFEDAFLAGLLHDIGIVLADQHVHDNFRYMLENALDPQKTLCEIERTVLGFDHCMLGDRVAEAWRFPESARAAIRYHHDSMRYRGTYATIVRCVEIANVVCTLKGCTSIGMRLTRAGIEAFQALGFGREDVVVLATDLDREIRENGELFEI